jgi:glycerol-3-phosphate dehydrogenase (NAD(P)+)
MKITVLGAGAWGTALAIAFSARHTVTLWARKADVRSVLSADRENRRLLPAHLFPETLRIGDDFAAAAATADLLIVATPISGLRPTLCRLREAGVPRPLIWVCKGLEAETAKLPHQVVAEELGPQALCGALSGPSFAEEVARGLPAAVTLAANDADFGHRTALALHSPHFRIYANDDLPGVEVGGGVKNIMAIATGVCDGLGLGLNARAALDYPRPRGDRTLRRRPRRSPANLHGARRHGGSDPHLYRRPVAQSPRRSGSGCRQDLAANTA